MPSRSRSKAGNRRGAISSQGMRFLPSGAASCPALPAASRAESRRVSGRPDGNSCVHVGYTGAGRRGAPPPCAASGDGGRQRSEQAGAVRAGEGAGHPTPIGDDEGRAGARDRARGGIGMPTEPEPVTLSRVVHRAVQVVDPDGSEGGQHIPERVEGGDQPPAPRLRRFEEAQDPLSAAQADAAAQRIAEGIGALDPQEEDGAVQMAGAVATYLAYRRDQVDEDPGALLELAAKAEFNGSPPEVVRAWLADVGIAL